MMTSNSVISLVILVLIVIAIVVPIVIIKVFITTSIGDDYLEECVSSSITMLDTVAGIMIASYTFHRMLESEANGDCAARGRTVRRADRVIPNTGTNNLQLY